jgi:hypothetical protein
MPTEKHRADITMDRLSADAKHFGQAGLYTIVNPALTACLPEICHDSILTSDHGHLLTPIVPTTPTGAAIGNIRCRILTPTVTHL